ncbi:hypothetical protein CCR94_02270 [Rhodoblastus sphagnicola]|uniref:Uncharacterized protein n=1 Tax=Rhodoblastus sphagnicola TaxID=333368 RepID=A0A2S6NF71_9HYPH|nr:hypothetical protein CCR94_02270 [Rhodoblastus sphagnicola]
MFGGRGRADDLLIGIGKEIFGVLVRRRQFGRIEAFRKGHGDDRRASARRCRSIGDILAVRLAPGGVNLFVQFRRNDEPMIDRRLEMINSGPMIVRDLDVPQVFIRFLKHFGGEVAVSVGIRFLRDRVRAQGIFRLERFGKVDGDDGPFLRTFVPAIWLAPSRIDFFVLVVGQVEAGAVFGFVIGNALGYGQVVC